MRIVAAAALLMSVPGCAHISAPAGWDCRASIEQDGIRADGWLHLSPSGRASFTRAEWWLQRPISPVLRFGAGWDSSAPPIDWAAGRVELIFASVTPAPPERRRMELHAGGRRILHGGWDNGANLLLTGTYGAFRSAASHPGAALVVVSEAGKEVARRAFDSEALQRGAAMAAEALATAVRKSGDYKRQCEPAPEIMVT